jgi:hypothetical protein
MRKEKKKEKRKTLPVAGGLEARPSQPARSSRADGLSEPSSFPPFLSRARVAGLGAAAATRSLPCFADEWTRHVSHALLPLTVTEPETNTTATEPNRVSRDFLPENFVLGL